MMDFRKRGEPTFCLIQKVASPLFLLFISISCGGVWNVQKETYDEVIQSEAVTPDKSPLKIIVFDVGEGDSSLIIAPTEEAALIDAGPPGAGGSKIIPYLSSNEGIDLKYIFISHDDSDHTGGVQEVAGTFSPDDGIKELSNTKAGDVFALGAVSIAVLAANCELSDGTKIACDPTDDNAHSLAMLIKYGEFTYFTAGDLPGGGGEPPYQTIDIETPLAPLVGDVDVLHVSHHGSNTSTNQVFLDATKPEAAIISVGVGNGYWHPHPSVVERLLNAGIGVYLTERGWLKDEYIDNVGIVNGDIVIESDGVDFTTSIP